MLTRMKGLITKPLKVFNDVAKQQFVVKINGEKATLDYEKGEKGIKFVHTDVPSVFQGKGVGKQLGKYAFDYALENKLEVVVKCHFLAKYYKDNINQYKELKVDLQLD